MNRRFLAAPAIARFAALFAVVSVGASVGVFAAFSAAFPVAVQAATRTAPPVMAAWHEKLRLAMAARSREPPAIEADWRPGSFRIHFREDGGRSFHARGPGPGPVRAWVVGRVRIGFAEGLAGLPAASGGALQSLTGDASAGGGMTGGAVLIRHHGGKELLLASFVGGAADGTAALAGATWGPAGVLVSGGPHAAPRASCALGLRRSSGDRISLEAARSGHRSRFGIRLDHRPAGIAASLRFRLDTAGGGGRTSPPPGPSLTLELRDQAFGRPLTAGARAETLARGAEGAGRTSTSIWLETSVKLAGGARAGARVERRRRDDRDQSRAHAEIAAGAGRISADWLSGGPVLLTFRARLELPARIALEGGAASWSGALAGSGARLDLPRVPGAAPGGEPAAPGQAAALAIGWQASRVHVRLGIVARRDAMGVEEQHLVLRIDRSAREAAER